MNNLQSEEKKAERRAAQAAYARERRANRTEEQKEKEKELERKRREKRTEEEKEKKKEADRKRAANRTEEEKERRREADRKRAENRTEEEKERRREAERKRAENRTEEEKEKKKEADQQRAANQSQEEKALRAENARKRRANLSLEERARVDEINENNKRQRLAQQAQTLKHVAENAINNENEVEEHSCGTLSSLCDECKAMHFETEKFNNVTVTDATGNLQRVKVFNKCCKNGQIKLESLKEYPEPFLSLMKKTHITGDNFMENIRSINSSFAFASMGANYKLPQGYGPYCFRIHGQIYHRTGVLHPQDGEQRQYAQLYILDTEEANSERSKHAANSNVNSIVFNEVADFMDKNNPFSKAYKMLHEVEKEARKDAEENGLGEVEKVAMAIVQNRNLDKRRYNAATANEVAVVFSNKDGLPPTEHDLIIHLRASEDDPNKGMQRINMLDKNLEAMVYPILFPYGEQGWGTDLERKKTGARNRVSLMEYYSHRLSIRNEFNPLLNAGKLTQQYFVDAYVKVEGNRLNYIMNNQKEWRGDTLKGLKDYVANRAELQGKQPGNVVILPSSYPGGPRYMQQNYQDAMAIVTKFGKPDLFVTMTCNPKWKEIRENLEPWQSVENRPDLVAKVFNIKLKNLLNEITDKNGGIFGKVVGHVFVIEFQKRGLPHAHMLLILDQNSKLNTEDKIDKVVSAEIPDKDTNPMLFEIVTSHMVHGPCGKGISSPCMEGDKCQKDYPKNFNERTIGGEDIRDGYALYRRRRGTEVVVKNKVIDNRWIVPYNPYLALKYNCHINVEVCASVQSVKYLFKYVYKGHDCANLEVKDSNVINQDEIKDHVDSRYVSAPEAAWRLFGNDMHGQSHSVERLAVHLPLEQFIVFDMNPNVNNEEGNVEEMAERNNVDNVVQRRIEQAESQKTTLTGWFELNRTDPTAHQYHYWEIPLHYTWLKKERKWKIRERFFNKIGRMYTVSPKDFERFYLRLLLLHVKGATSFDDLKSFEGVQYETFREAAKARGFLLDDDVWQTTLKDAAEISMPPQLRQLYAYICAFCNPSDPKKLWYDNLKDLTEDICRNVHDSSGDCQNCEYYALKEVKAILILHRITKLELLGLPEPPADLGEWRRETVENVEFYRAEAVKMMESLNYNQKLAFDAIVNSIFNRNEKYSKFFYLDGPGGSGKTYLYRTLLQYVKAQNGIAIPTASTGIAANLLPGGRTYHSVFRFKIPINKKTMSNFTREEKERLMAAWLIIINECTMASCHAMDAIDRVLKDVMGNIDLSFKDIPFGGKVILLGGDFRQCLTIVPHGKRSDITQQSLKRCNAWRGYGEYLGVRKYSLTDNMRSVDSEYSDWLLKLGDGTLEGRDDLGDDLIEIPEKVLCSKSIIEEVFGTSINADTIRTMSKRAILCPKNFNVDNMNNEILNLIPGEEHIYLSNDSVDDQQYGAEYPIEFLNSITMGNMPSHKLKLKKGAVVMLLWNLNSREGLCNGTKFYVTQLHRNLIEGEILMGSAEGRRVLIPRIDMCPADSDLPFKIKRRQFPVKLSFAMTINKAQGQTFDRVGIFLPKPVFGHGQLYVAFSRVRRFEDVKVLIEETHEQGKLDPDSEKIFTKNIVYREIFNH